MIMTLEKFRTLKSRDFQNGAVLDEIEATLEGFEDLRSAVRQLAADHPDTPVTWPHKGVTRYQELRDWASHVLGEAT